MCPRDSVELGVCQLRLRECFEKLSREDDPDARVAHFIDRGADIARLQIDPAAGVLDEVGAEAEGGGVQSGELDAVIRREAGDIDIGYTPVPEIIPEPRRLAVAVVIEAAVAIDRGISSLCKDLLPLCLIQPAREFRAGGILNAVDRPEDLRQPGEFDPVSRHVTGVIGGETAMICGMPILSGDNEIEARHEVFDDRDDLVAIRNCERASGQEIILDIDED